MEYVDLGYGLKFATCNLGAEKPEDYGMYFQWGSIEGELVTDKPSKKYYFDNCPYTKGLKWSFSSVDKYNNGDYEGTVDNKIVLDETDDAATQMLGTDWRIPTFEELKMIIDESKFDSEWTQVNGVNGRKFTSKENGNSIFIPASGSCLINDLYNRNNICYLWTSSLDEKHSIFVRSLGFDSDDLLMGVCSRFHGYSIRPVFIG